MKLKKGKMIRKFNHKVLLLLLLLTVSRVQLLGQEFPSSLQYINNMQTLNPAFVGMWDKAGFMLSTRTNWITIKGAPLIHHFSAFTPIKDQLSGIGLNVKRITEGLEKRLFFTADYSYQIRLDMYNYMRFGLRAGVVNFDNSLTQYQLYPDRIPDSEFASDIHLYFMSVLGFGTMIYNDHYYASLSIPQIIGNTFQVNRDIITSKYDFKTIYLSGSYVFKLPGDIRLRPNLLVVGTMGKSVYFDAAALLYLPMNLNFGINVRSNGTVCFSGQYTFANNFKIGYAADYALVSDIRKYQLGTYEFLVGYDFNINRRKSVKPVYF